MYQINNGEWNSFGYTGWSCQEESEVVKSHMILINANFEKAFNYFYDNPDCNIISNYTFILQKPYIVLYGYSAPKKLFKKDFLSISIKVIQEEAKNITLEWVMRHLSADKAIQFLKERGMAICPEKQ